MSYDLNNILFNICYPPTLSACRTEKSICQTIHGATIDTNIHARFQQNALTMSCQSKPTALDCRFFFFTMVPPAIFCHRGGGPPPVLYKLANSQAGRPPGGHLQGVGRQSNSYPSLSSFLESKSSPKSLSNRLKINLRLARRVRIRRFRNLISNSLEL